MRILGILSVWLTLMIALPALAAISGLQRVATGLHNPAFATHVPGDPNRLFVAELSGRVKVIDLNTNTNLGTFLNITDTDATGEGGLLGLAFHPNYLGPTGTPGRGKFYVYVTVDNGGDTSLGVTSPFSSRVREYTVLGDPATSNVADTSAASRREILSFVQPQANHNAGWIGFNPQVTPNQPQYLYIASGDGGGGYDNQGGHSTLPDAPGNAQDLTNNFLGKMLRIDVNGDDFPTNAAKNYAIPPTNPFKAGVGIPEDDFGDDEVWAYGLRNPFRDSFDRRTGDLWIGDVGQNQREEIDFQPASSPGGENYGWRLREGTFQTQNVGGPLLSSYTQPIYDYGRGSGPLLGETVIGGYRYRGPDPQLQGRYFFGDSSDDNMWQMTLSSTGVPTVTNIDATLGSLFSSVDTIGSFGEDANGNLYIVDLSQYDASFNPIPNTGEIYRILTDTLLQGDYNADGRVDSGDFTRWRQTFGATGTNLPADGNKDGTVNAADYVLWRKMLGANVYTAGGGSGSNVPEPGVLVQVATALAAVSSALFARRRVL